MFQPRQKSRFLFAGVFCAFLFVIAETPRQSTYAAPQERVPDFDGPHRVDANGFCPSCQNSAVRSSFNRSMPALTSRPIQDVGPETVSPLPGPAKASTPYYRPGNSLPESLGPGLRNRQDLSPEAPGLIGPAQTADSCTCPKCGVESPMQTCTIYVPYWETDYQTHWETRYRLEPRFKARTVYRIVTHRVPESVDYEVMVPQQKTVQYTTYKTFEEKEPVIQNYQIYVPVQKKRKITTYRTEVLKQDELEAYSVTVPEVRERVIPYYRVVPQSRTITREYTVYRDVPQTVNVPVYRQVRRTSTVTREYEELEAQPRERTETYVVREPVTVNQTTENKRVVPYTEEIETTVVERVPYVDQVEQPYEVLVPVPREVTKKYWVIVPRYRTVEQEYKIQIPVVENREGVRTIHKQVPQTFYREYRRDCGYWKTVTETVCETCGTANGDHGPMCSPATRTVCKTIWCPKIVVQRIPCTVYKMVAEQVPYTYPVTVMKTEKRVRRYPIVQYEKEERSYVETEYAYNKETRTQILNVARTREVSKTVKVPVQKYRTITESQQVPVTEFREVTKTRTVPFTDLVKVKRSVQVEQPYFETVPGFVQQQTTVKKAFKETRTFTVTEYVNEPAFKTEKYTVLVPQTRYRSIPKTVYKKVPQITESTYTVMVPETRTRTVYKTSYKRVPELRERIYTVMEPEKRTRIVYRTVTEQIPEQKLERTLVTIPYKVPRLVPRRVCKLVPKTIQVPTDSCSCGHVADHADIQQARDAYGRLLNETVAAGYRQFVDRK